MDGDSTDYLNYEVILVETIIEYIPKTSIISEAPFGFVFMVFALIGIAFWTSYKRKLVK